MIEGRRKQTIGFSAACVLAQWLAGSQAAAEKPDF